MWVTKWREYVLTEQTKNQASVDKISLSSKGFLNSRGTNFSFSLCKTQKVLCKNVHSLNVNGLQERKEVPD